MNEVAGILSGVCTHVFYYYPASWVTLPCVSWRESGNRLSASAGGQEHLAELTYTVDVWSTSEETNAGLAAQIDARMAAANFLRTYSADLFETGTRLHHRVLRYRVIADSAGNGYRRA